MSILLRILVLLRSRVGIAALTWLVQLVASRLRLRDTRATTADPASDPNKRQ